MCSAINQRTSFSAVLVYRPVMYVVPIPICNGNVAHYRQQQSWCPSGALLKQLNSLTVQDALDMATVHQEKFRPPPGGVQL